MTEPNLYPDLPTEDWKWDQETRNRATGLKCALMNFQNIVALVVLQCGLGTVKGLSIKLQKRNSDIYHAYQMIDSVINDVVEMRESVDTVWGEWYGEACSLAEQLGSEPAMPRITRVQRNRANVPADTPSEYYKRSIAIPFLDNFEQQLRTRFSKDNRQMKSIMALVPPVLLNYTSDQLTELSEQLLFWDTDLVAPSGQSLKQELSRWQRYWSTKDTEQLPHNLLDCLEHADGDLFPDVRRLVMIGCTSPIGSCEAERSFSALRRVKTSTRSTMGEERLAGLTLMSVHFREAMQLDSSHVARVFVQKHRRKMFCNSILLE